MGEIERKDGREAAPRRRAEGARAGSRRSTAAAAGLGAALALGLVAVSCGRGHGVPVSHDAPVILISIDTLRADHLPAYGYTKIRTPFIDAFAKDSWLFENAYTPCPMTLPAHTTMLTGELPPEHGVRNNVGFVFDGRAHPSLPLLLKAQGYATGAAVSSYVLRSDTGLGPLFDYYEDSTEAAPGMAPVHYRRTGDKTEAVAKEWIAKHAGEPFFFFFHIYEPHLPYNPPEPFLSLYGKTYDGAIASADAIIGTFLDDLKRLGVYDRAIVVLVGDHGEGLGDHGEEQHSILLYREAIHVPMIVKLPGEFGAGRRIGWPAQLSDIVPTVTSVLGIATPKEVSGSSLVTMDAKAGSRRVLYSETLYPRLQLGWSDLHSTLDARYQYIQGPRPELYDMVADPAEKHDLIASRAADAARLAADLQKFPQGSDKPAAVDQETLRRLAALGYIGGLRDTAASPALPNPVDNLQYLQRMQDGWRLADEKEFPQAIAALRAILKDNPGMVDVWLKLGEVLTNAGFDEEAAAAYRDAMRRSPIFLPDASVSLGYVELNLKHLPKAEAAARRALKDVPTKAHELLARVAIAKGDFAAATEEARAAAAERNPQPPALLVMAEVQLGEGKPADALATVERAAQRANELRFPQVYNLEYLRGDALARLNRMPEAEAAFRREIAAFPAHSRAYANLAVIRFIQGDRAGVAQLMDAMARANPTGQTYLLAATTFGSLGEKAEAAAWQRRASAAADRIKRP
ncbi:MAG: tetratricopeptide repeat protein [Acidobacteria bacterium]|nr:MAG: tetratricopeptide repeat protein [Acidobacteriota bacterium]